MRQPTSTSSVQPQLALLDSFSTSENQPVARVEMSTNYFNMVQFSKFSTFQFTRVFNRHMLIEKGPTTRLSWGWRSFHANLSAVDHCEPAACIGQKWRCSRHWHVWQKYLPEILQSYTRESSHARLLRRKTFYAHTNAGHSVSRHQMMFGALWITLRWCFEPVVFLTIATGSNEVR